MRCETPSMKCSRMSSCRSGKGYRHLVFLSEKLRDIEQERGALALRSIDVRRAFNDALRDTFDPLPRTNLQGTLAVASGLKIQSVGLPRAWPVSRTQFK